MSDLAALSDSELISLCLKNDSDAWGTLLRRYQRLIASITVKFKLSKEDSGDVFQAVSIVLFKQLSHLRRDGKLSSWFITVTVRECWKLRQRSGRTVVLDDPAWEAIAAQSSNPDTPTSEEQILLLERQHLVRTALKQLGPNCQNLLEKLFYSPEQLSYTEVAQQAGLPIASIGPTRGRCLAKLKEALRKIGYR